ncbi:hypothetical protein NHX12_033237 [Muraenolepis orangiensis]|uniref:Fibronectin type-III domain-containing protein n=1 Tax=Muraenolepis orangiensis TaxID=630683 RepID=A0A9Q0IHS7_9TELE|nr:hypothetical protein NHX12_033237 [Muraenolepis orangiensis]
MRVVLRREGGAMRVVLRREGGVMRVVLRREGGAMRVSSVVNSSLVESQRPAVVLEGLRPGTGYLVQVRARTVAGYGPFSKEMLFHTLTDDEYKSELGQQLSLIAGSLVGGVFIVSLVAIAIICTR